MAGGGACPTESKEVFPWRGRPRPRSLWRGVGMDRLREWRARAPAPQGRRWQARAPAPRRARRFFRGAAALGRGMEEEDGRRGRLPHGGHGSLSVARPPSAASPVPKAERYALDHGYSEGLLASPRRVGLASMYFHVSSISFSFRTMWSNVSSCQMGARLPNWWESEWADELFSP